MRHRYAPLALVALLDNGRVGLKKDYRHGFAALAQPLQAKTAAPPERKRR